MIIILGDGAHAKVVQSVFGAPLAIHCWDSTDISVDDELCFGMAHPQHKRQLVEMHGSSHKFASAIHRRSFIDDTVLWKAPGVQVMAGAILQYGVFLGRYTLVNTGAQIDHDCVIGDYCHIGPGAILCGNVTLGDDCVIGAGTVVVQGVSLDAGTKISAGSLVVRQDDVRASRRVLRGN